jgi:hypothetical protein
VDVQVDTGSGFSAKSLAARFFFDPPIPTVTSLSANHGPQAGGTPVNISGANLASATGVSVGGTAVAFTFNPATNQIQISTPAHAAGVVDIQVTNDHGTSVPSLGGQFFYDP